MTTHKNNKGTMGCIGIIFLMIGIGWVIKTAGCNNGSSDSSTPVNDEYTGSATCCACHGNGKADNAMNTCMACGGSGSLKKSNTYYRANCR